MRNGGSNWQWVGRGATPLRRVARRRGWGDGQKFCRVAPGALPHYICTFRAKNPTAVILSAAKDLVVESLPLRKPPGLDYQILRCAQDDRKCKCSVPAARRRRE